LRELSNVTTIEYFMGMLAGSLLGYFVAIMLGTDSEAGHR
jgi:hypothetical protein